MVFNEDYHINMLMSNKDVYIRFDKFRTGEINKLIIPGLSGSGKSFLARELAQRFNCPCIELDKFRGNVYYTDEEMKREHPYIYKYFKTEFTKGDRHNIAKMESEERREEFEKFVYWLLKQPERMVIEGALEKILYDNDEMRKTYPMVFKGTSMLKSMARMSWREFHRDHPGRDPIDNLLWWVKWCTKYKKMTDQHNNVREKIMGDVDMDDYEEREENDLPLIMEAMGYKPHPIVFSDDDVYINYDKWKSGECTSLLVTGLSGGGKSTLSKKLAEKFNAYYVEIDIISFGIGIRRPKNANWEYIKEHDKYLYKYFKESNIAPTIMQQFKDYQDLKKNKIIDKYIYWLCFERDDLDSNRVVIEGGDVAIALSHIKELSNLPIVIKGTSLSKSLGRRMYRTIETKDNGLYKTIVNILDGTYISQYSKMYPEVNAARKTVMDQEYEEVHESFLPNLTFYHGSRHKFDKILPMAFSAGNKLKDPSWGVFMFRQKDLAELYALMTIMRLVCREKDIPRPRGWLEKDGFMHYKFIIVLPKEYYDIVKETVIGLSTYVYTLQVPINRQLDIIGTTGSLPEYIYSGIPKTVKREEIVIDSEIFDKIITKVSMREYNRIKKDKPHRYNTVGPWVDWFVNVEERERMRNLVKEKMEKGELQPGDDLSWLKEEMNNNTLPSLKLQNKRNIFLTSAGLEDVEVRRAFLSSYNKNIKGSKVLFVTAAAIDKESIEFLKECWNDLLNININPQNIIEFNFDRHFTYNDFMRFDIVYICGGDENHLIKVINNSGMRESFIKAVNNGLVYIGVSAGACIASPYVKNGLNFIQNKVDVHYPDEEAIANGDVPPKNVQINLSNRQAVWIYGNTIQIIGSKNISESHILKHTFTHKELCDIYQNQLVTENSAIYIPHESGNITQYIPGAYFNEEVGVWMRKPNQEEQDKIRLIESSYDPKTGKIIYTTKSDDKFLEVFEADEKEWLDKVYYKSFPNVKFGEPQPVIDINGNKFRPRCEVIIIDDDKALIDPSSNRGGMGYSCPGGGIDPNESIADGAKRECEEEARVIPKDIIYTGLAWTLEFKTKSIAYFGSISFICVATKKKDYKGYVKVVDRDKFVDNATWIPISKLSKPHQMAIDIYNKLFLKEEFNGYEFHPLTEAKPAWDPKLWRDPGPNIRNFDIKKELKTFMYPQAIKEKYKGPNFYINLPGLSKDKRFRVRCEMIILDSEGRMLVDMQREFKRLGLSMEFPGGGIDPGETILDAASRESKEEARVIVKDAIDTQLYYAYEVPEDSKLAYGYWGVASFICIGKYKKKYNGYIKKDDRDSFLARAEWIKPEDLKDLLPIHKQALKMYKNFYLQESLGINMEFLNNEYI